MRVTDKLDEQLVIKQAVGRLSPSSRAIFSLLFAGYTQREVGDIFGLTRAAVGFRHKQIMDQLKEFLGGVYGA